MWTPTRRKIGEGGTDGEVPGAGTRYFNNQTAPRRSTGVVSTACRKGNQRQWGRLGMVAGIANRERRQKGRRTIWASERVRCTHEAG